MRDALASRWPALALRGAFAVLFGILAIVWPGATVLTLVLLFGAYALAEGVMSGIMAFAEQPPQPRWLLGLEAVVGVAVGLIAFTRPGITALAMVVYLGAWAVVAGALRILQAVSLRRQISNEWLLGLSGALSVLMGLVVLARPAAGALALAWLVGVLAIAFGITEISLAMRLRQLPARTAGSRLWSVRTAEEPEVARKRVER